MGTVKQFFTNVIKQKKENKKVLSDQKAILKNQIKETVKRCAENPRNMYNPQIFITTCCCKLKNDLVKNNIDTSKFGGAKLKSYLKSSICQQYIDFFQKIQEFQKAPQEIYSRLTPQEQDRVNLNAKLDKTEIPLVETKQLDWVVSEYSQELNIYMLDHPTFSVEKALNVDFYVILKELKRVQKLPNGNFIPNTVSKIMKAFKDNCWQNPYNPASDYELYVVAQYARSFQ